MLVGIDYLSFRPNISVACFKLPFFILSCLFFFRSAISSACSGVKLSFSLNEPVASACLTHLSKAEAVSSKSRMISARVFPAR